MTAKLEDRGANLPDRVVDPGYHSLEPFGTLITAEPPGDALHREAGGEQLLDDVVMQIACDPITVLQQHHALLIRSRISQLECDRSVGRERGSHGQVGVVELVSAAQSAYYQRSTHTLCPDEGQHHDRPDREQVGKVHMDCGVLAHVAYQHRAAAVERDPDECVLNRIGVAGELVGEHAGGNFHHQALAVRGRQHYGHNVGVGDLLGLPGDQCQGLFALDGKQLAGDLHRRLQPSVAALGLFEKPGVLDGNPGARRERGQQLLVLGAELATCRLGQVEVAEHGIAHPNRRAEKPRHRRVVGRESDRAGIV